MIVIGAALTGIVLGGWTAKRRGGALADIAQYAASFGVIFALIGLIATVVIHRMAV